MANEIDGEYRYLGRREGVEESDLSRYIVAEENADIDSGDRDFYRQRLSLTESGWEDFIRDIDQYQIHELEFSLYNDSDEPIRDIWLYSDRPEVVVQYDILYFKPVYVAPHAEFTAHFNVYIRVDAESGGERPGGAGRRRDTIHNKDGLRHMPETRPIPLLKEALRRSALLRAKRWRGLKTVQTALKGGRGSHRVILSELRPRI